MYTFIIYNNCLYPCYSQLQCCHGDSQISSGSPAGPALPGVRARGTRRHGDTRVVEQRSAFWRFEIVFRILIWELFFL